MNSILRYYFKLKKLIKPSTSQTVNDITKGRHGIQRVVVCAANKVYSDVWEDGWLIIPANRHHSPLMNKLYDALDCSRFTGSIKLDLRRTEQGFIDQWGDFMSREEALKVALASGQRINMKRNGSSTQLFSEGLY